jgi:hypothetical protein
MFRAALRIVIAVSLVGAGWIAGTARTTEPDFEIVVDAPEGETKIECVRGCDLAWVERGVNPNATPVATFTFRCGGPAAAPETRCSSYKVGGWLRR